MSDELLTLPGSIPRLLRRGSPVTHIDGSCLVVVKLDGADAKLPSGWAYTRLLDLDLTDATGRAHAAWWLAGGDTTAYAPRFHAFCLRRRVVGCYVGGLPYVDRIAGYAKLVNHGAKVVPALATLDPNDPRLLPDGSRWVDAEALRLVCLHVAGLEVPRG